MSSPVRVRAFAPGSVGNIGPGLDILGMAVTGAGDRVDAETSTEPGIQLRDSGHPELPADPDRHSCGIAARAVLARAGREGQGVILQITKGLPLAAGQGGSAASAVAAAVAVNQLLGRPLDTDGLLLASLEAETAVAGRHADNVAPSLLGGIILIRSLDPLDLVSLPVPPGLALVLAHPAQVLETRTGRSVLPDQIDREVALHQAAQVAAMAAALALGDLELLGRAIDDRIAEPARAPLLPGFRQAKRAALNAGALGCSISGSGPTAFALARPAAAEAVATAMREAYAREGIGCVVRVAAVDTRGARIEPLA
ncbi:MAG: homoserine kinase [Gemmatimonadales bacterium]